jgi:UDP-glucose 4-epimerase
MDKILVTGGAGFIGSHLIDELIKQNYEVYGFDNHFPGWGNHHNNPLCHYINGDLRNFEQVDFALTNMDYCIHLGAISHVKTCRENPKLAYDVNVGGTINILESCRKHNIKRLIYAGTDHIYGSKNYKYQPIDELHPLNGIFEDDIYGKSKAFAVEMTRIYNRLYKLSIIIILSGNVFSERQNLPNVIPSFINSAFKNEDLIIHGNGKQTREFYHISNLCDAYIKCIKTPNINGELFNVSGENELTINQLAQKILELIPESKSKIIHIPDECGHNIMEKISLNIDKAKKLLGYKIITSFEEGLKNTIEKNRMGYK